MWPSQASPPDHPHPACPPLLGADIIIVHHYTQLLKALYPQYIFRQCWYEKALNNFTTEVL